MACYAIDEQRMYVPGESVRGIPIEYPLTHEYGHHVALWRSNAPWDALDWGAKYWSSSVGVCKQVQRHVLFPGNQGAHYWDDPGEGFADSYAHLHYPQAPWSYNDLMRPTRRTLAALQRDVLHPWSGPRTRTFHGRVGPRHRTRTFHIRLRLDGDLTMRLAAPARLRLRRAGRDPGLRGRPAAARRRRLRRAVVPPPARRPREADGPPPRGQRAVRAAGQLAGLTPTDDARAVPALGKTVTMNSLSTFRARPCSA